MPMSSARPATAHQRQFFFSFFFFFLVAKCACSFGLLPVCYNGAEPPPRSPSPGSPYY